MNRRCDILQRSPGYWASWLQPVFTTTLSIILLHNLFPDTGKSYWQILSTHGENNPGMLLTWSGKTGQETPGR